MVAALLSFAAGLAKIRSPRPAVAALDAVGIRVGAPIVQVGAALEAALAVTVIVTGSTGATALLASTFALFATFVALARRRPKVTSCGCFGGQGERPAVRHVVVNGILAVLVALAAAAGPSGIADVLRHQPLAGVPFVGVTLAATWLAYLVLINHASTRVSSAEAPALP